MDSESSECLVGGRKRRRTYGCRFVLLGQGWMHTLRKLNERKKKFKRHHERAREVWWKSPVDLIASHKDVDCCNAYENA